MYASIATEPGRSDKQSEDWAGVSATTAVLLDGLSSARDAKSGCLHGTPWFVGHLGVQLLAGAAVDPKRPLKSVLAESIERVAKLHPMCDLAHPGSPSATVAIMRANPNGSVEYLVLADTRVVLEGARGVHLATDERVDFVAGDARDAALREQIGSQGHQRAIAELIATQQPLRNHPGGYWIAAADPSAADHALTGSVPATSIDHAALLSDGASRLVDTFEAATWEEVLALARDNGPHHVIARVREFEASDPDGRRWPRYKTSDDASMIYVHW